MCLIFQPLFGCIARAKCRLFLRKFSWGVMENNHKSCNTCLRTMQSHSVFIECANCHHVYHVKYINAARNIAIPSALWYCMHCMQTISPFNHIEDNQAFFSDHGMCLWLSFSVSWIEHQDVHSLWNERKHNTAFTEMDPEIQLYSSTHHAINTRCEYFIEDTFLTISLKNVSFGTNSHYFVSIWRACPNNELKLYINSLNFKFSVIFLTENWLDESKQDLFDLEGYNCLHKFRKEKRGGGVPLYVENGIDFINMPDLEYFDSEMESLFIEAEGSGFNLSSNIAIAVIYRMPNTSLDIFNDLIASILNTTTRVNILC